MKEIKITVKERVSLPGPSAPYQTMTKLQLMLYAKSWGQEHVLLCPNPSCVAVTDALDAGTITLQELGWAND